jgi:hypothetical protein
MSELNWLMALSNLPVIQPIYQTIMARDYWTMLLIIFVGSMSFVSHLVENHKHGMPGIGFSRLVSYFLNRLDVIGSIWTFGRFLQLYHQKFGMNISGIVQNKMFFISLLISFLFLRVSEYDKYNLELRPMYIVLHCVWHVSIYTIMNYFLREIIYI